MEHNLQSRLTKADTLLQAAEKALTPFAAAVYNDNGDMTISAVYESRDSYVAAYYARKRLREYFAAQQKDKGEGK